MTNAERQAAWRNRRANTLTTMQTALQEIAKHTDGKTGPVAVEIRKLAMDALGEKA